MKEQEEAVEARLHVFRKKEVEIIRYQNLHISYKEESETPEVLSRWNSYLGSLDK